MVDNKKQAVEAEIKVEELKNIEQNKEQNIEGQINNREFINQQKQEIINQPLEGDDNEAVIKNNRNDLIEELDEGRERVQENVPPEVEGQLINKGERIIVLHDPVVTEYVNINEAGEEVNIQNHQQANIVQNAIAGGEHTAEMNRILILLSSGKAVRRYQKSLKGWGSLTREQEEELTETRSNLAFINGVLSNENMGLSQEIKQRLTVLKGRYEAHLLLNDFRYKNDSDEMKSVKDSIMELENLLAQEVKTRIEEGDVNPENYYQNEEQLRKKAGVYHPLLAAYQKAINACKSYVDNKDPSYEKGKQRKRDTEAAMQRMASEMEDLMLGMQLLRRGIITSSENARDLISKAGVYRQTQQPMTTEYIDTHKDNSLRNYSPEKYLSTMMLPDYYKTMGKEGESVVSYIMSDKRLDKLFKPTKDRKLSKEDMKIKQAFVDFVKELRAFPKDKFYSKTFIIGKTSFNIFQSENSELILTWGNSVYKVNNSAQVMADDIAMRFAADEDIFGKETVRELAEWMRDDNLNMEDLQTELRVDALGKEIIAKRLNMRKSDLANVPVDKIRELTLKLLDGDLTIKQVKQELEDIEDRVLEKQKKGELSDQNEELAAIKNMMEGHKKYEAEVEKREETEIKAINDEVDKRLHLSYSKEYKELKRGNDFAKKCRDNLLKLGKEKDKAKIREVVSQIENEFNINFSEIRQDQAAGNNDGIPVPPQMSENQISMSAHLFLDQMIEGSDKTLEKLNENIRNRSSYLESFSELQKKEGELKRLKNQSQKTKLRDISLAIEDANKEYKQLVEKPANEMSEAINAIEEKINELNEAHMQIDELYDVYMGTKEEKKEKDVRAYHAKLRALTIEQKLLLEEKQKEYSAFLAKPEAASKEIAEA
ncbi:MAG: hypothetical protein J6N76_02940, partial [Lachnospiraceae bacterium]|nr:hypothetical protein [Lachnospiraceae bacterium]